jgi:hypothetical protein
MSGGEDAFVAKVDNGGDALLYFTYLGGSSSDQSFGLALDSLNNAWVTGLTCSTNFPTTPGAFEPSAPGLCDAYISKVDQMGNVVSSSYLGGKFFDQGNGVAVDSSCNSYVTGFTCSADLPYTAGAFQSANGGPSGNNIGVCGDSFLTRVASVTLNGRGAAIAVSGLGTAGDTGNMSTTRKSTKTASLAAVNTSIVKGTLLQSTVTGDECAGLSTADSRVASTTLSFSGAPTITAKTVEANSQTTCQGSTGTTNIGSIQIGNGTPSSGDFAPNTMMQLGSGNYLVLNEQMPSSTPDKSLTVSAMHLHAGGYDTLVGYAKSDVGSCSTSCTTGLTVCGSSGTPGFCRNLSSDPNNCGTCGHVCAGTCSAGVCH